MPYGDKDGLGRTYKNIVPAPPKGLEAKIASVPLASSSATIPATAAPAVQAKVRSPKRKRDDQSDEYDHRQTAYLEQTSSDHSCNSEFTHRH